MDTDIRNILLTTKICKNLDVDELNMLIQHNKIFSFASGESIIQQGKKSGGLFVILDGTALITTQILGEGIINIAKLHKGNFFGEISLIENGPSATSVIASTKVECLLLSENYFNMLSIFFSKTKHKLIEEIAFEVCFRINEIYSIITENMKKQDMQAKSLFKSVVESIKKPKFISYEEAKINKKYLNQFEFFQSLSHESYDALINCMDLIIVPKNFTLIHERAKNHSCYIILRGAVQTSIIFNNKKAKLSVLGPKNFFCSISIINNLIPSIINYTACEKAILLRITESNLIYLKENNIYIWYKIYDLICELFVSLERSADELAIRLNSEIYNR